MSRRQIITSSDLVKLVFYRQNSLDRLQLYALHSTLYTLRCTIYLYALRHALQLHPVSRSVIALVLPPSASPTALASPSTTNQRLCLVFSSLLTSHFDSPLLYSHSISPLVLSLLSTRFRIPPDCLPVPPSRPYIRRACALCVVRCARPSSSVILFYFLFLLVSPSSHSLPSHHTLASNTSILPLAPPPC